MWYLQELSLKVCGWLGVGGRHLYLGAELTHCTDALHRPEVDLVSCDDEKEVGGGEGVMVDGRPEEVVLKALQRLARLQLSREVRCVLHVRRLTIAQLGGVALYLPLCVRGGGRSDRLT